MRFSRVTECSQFPRARQQTMESLIKRGASLHPMSAWLCSLVMVECRVATLADACMEKGDPALLMIMRGSVSAPLWYVPHDSCLNTTVSECGCHRQV